MNPNSKVRWEQVFSSPSQHGSAHMMANSLLAHQFLTPPAQQFLPAPPAQQFLPTPPSTSMVGHSLVPSSGGAYWFSRAPTSSAPPAQGTLGFSGPSTLTSVQGAYTMPSGNGRDHGDVVTGIISIDSFDAYVLFDSGASFSFVSEGFVVHSGISVQQISQAITINSANGPLSSTFICPGCHISIADEDFVANLVIIPLDLFDVILGMCNTSGV
jgi:hypothetical protein